MKKQKLRKRTKKNTPTSASQARGNCDLQLNKEETLSVADSKTSLNAPEVNLSQYRTAKRKVVVYVISVAGNPLMPCSPAKCKKLLKAEKAKVYKMYPFTIQLNFECENQTQDITFGEDAGFINVGFSAVTNKKEVVSGTLLLDDKTSSRLTEKRMYRISRRSRHHWYRKPRFLNRKIKQGWLPPSTQRRYDSHLRLLKTYQEVLPITKVIIETGNFDIQKLTNPEIQNWEYQQGDMYGYQNVRSYLMAREKGLCQFCHKEFGKGTPAHIHHCLERSKKGSNSPKNLAILHKKCHEKLHKKGLKLSAPKTLKAETFMSIIQNRFLQDLPNIEITFGYKTFVDRNKLGLEKTHYNDAFVIAGGTNQERISPIEIKQKHRNNRVIQMNRKGFKPSVRKQRYKIQPKDLVWIYGKKYVVSGIFNKGVSIKVENSKKTFPTKNIEKIYNFGSFAFN
ncbi:MAG TPA: RNA-guided endonuclease IscB [Bacteroidia bacterium]|jgi:hypothetical protein|nr:RNA-guided endonuclease IscB [Bacteroidia bacterium]